jgi:prolyl oligopeptidase
VISLRQGTDDRNLLFYKDLNDRSHQAHELIRDRSARFEFIGNVGSTFYLRTDEGAERYRVIAIDLRRPDKQHWRTVIAQDPATLDEVTLVEKQLIANYLSDAHSEVRVLDLNGKPVRKLDLPGLGTAGGFTGLCRRQESFFSFSSYTTPTAIYRYDAKSGAVTPFKTPKSAFDGSPFETRQVFFPSKDGTRVPMFVTARRGLALDGSNPTILYGYGGFNVSVTPTYSANVAAWLEMGGVYAVATLRGGGEYGRSWHEGGMKTRKQNVFDDFASAAEYLIAEKITSPKKLAISGARTAVCWSAPPCCKRPELFGAACPRWA